MTDRQRKVLELLAKTWNAFCELDCESPEVVFTSDVKDFRDAIHNAQKVVAMIVVRKDHPEEWRKTNRDSPEF